MRVIVINYSGVCIGIMKLFCVLKFWIVGLGLTSQLTAQSWEKVCTGEKHF